MSRAEESSRRPGRPVSGTEAAPHPLLSMLAHASKATDLLPSLHQHALDAASGDCSLLFRHNPRNGTLQATSGFGLDLLPTDPWLPADEEAAVLASAFEHRSPTLVADADRRMPALAARLGTRCALLLPLVRGADRVGLLAIGFRNRPAREPGDEVAEAGDAFLAALELFHLRQSDELQRDVRALLDEFARSLSASLNLSAALDVFCQGANLLFGADRTSVWVHERRARHLVLRASSDTGHASHAAVSADDGGEPAAVGMRRSRAEIISGGAETTTSMVTVPLRGTRRALGTLIFEGVRVEPGGELDLLDRADELGRQLSSAIENMQLLDEVQRSRQELENTFDSIAHLVAVADSQGRIVHANLAFAARLERSRDDLLDQPLVDVVDAKLGRWIARHQAGGEGDAPVSVEIADAVLKGSFVVTLTSLRNREGDRVGCVLVARDLSPETRLEAEREELRKRLTQSEKLAALGQFVAGVAHELNNPLQGVLGHLELLRVTGAFPKQLRREVQTIYREADRAAKIVRNLLVFAGSRRVRHRSVSLNAVVQRVLSLRASACRALDIELVRHYDDQLPRVQSDPLLLHQVFLNMVMNAEHAIASTGRGGRIEIATRVSPGRNRIVATVRDTGTGIPEDKLPRIFEPFYTTKEVGQGTGLGLAIAYGIVQDHGGQIVASNHPEGGAVFTVELPAAAAPPRKSA
jgi:signal transduction histidine kinase